MFWCGADRWEWNVVIEKAHCSTLNNSFGDDEGEVRRKPRMVVTRSSKGPRMRLLDQEDIGRKRSVKMDII